MSIASYIREIGRGKDGARSLTEAQAHDLMAKVLDRSVSDLEIGAFALAMRIKGETVAELAGFLAATAERCLPVRPLRPAVVLPSYNGARKLPNLTPLLALLLAQNGVPVIVHGPATDPARVTSAEIFRDLGLAIARDAEDIDHAWSRRDPVFVTTDVLCPPLARLLDVRRVVGLRNPGHTVAKLLDPCRDRLADGSAAAPRALRVVNYTHPEYGRVLREFAAATHASLMLMRGTEGEPVADPRRLPQLDVYIDGVARPDLSRPAHAGVLTGLPLLPRSCDAATTANYIQSVISGEKPAPAPLLQQVEALIAALDALPAGAAGATQRPSAEEQTA
jgi:anthranilate phosphoribosyltransferase